MPLDFNTLTRPQTLNIEDRAVSEKLLVMQRLKYLEPFMEQPRTLSEAAKMLDISLSRYNYWVKYFLEHGLVDIVFEKERSGTPIKYYWCSADTFLFVANTQDLIELNYQSTFDFFQKNVAETLVTFTSQFLPNVYLYVRHGPTGCLQSQYMVVSPDDPSKKWVISEELKKDGAPIIYLDFGDMHLEHEDANSLRTDLQKLLTKYKSMSNLKAQNCDKAQIYSINVSLAPTKISH